MPKKAKVVLPLAPVPDLVRWWRSQRVRGIVIGGVAVSLLARPRVTRDLDALVILPKDRWSAFLHSGLPFGFAPRAADAIEFAQEARVLLLRHEPSAIDVDVSLGELPFEEETIARAILVKVAGLEVLLPTAEDLVIMKAVAHRDQDMLDLDGLLVAHPRLDVARVRHWVRLFAEMLEAPELLEDLEKRLTPRSKRGKK